MKAALLVLLGASVAHAAELDVQATPNTTRLMPYQVFEITFQHTGKYADPTWDVTIELALASPSGRTVTVGGFFYGSSKAQRPVVREWKDGRGHRRSQATWPCDPDDDGDGWSDEDEKKARTDPHNALSFPEG